VGQLPTLGFIILEVLRGISSASYIYTKFRALLLLHKLTLFLSCIFNGNAALSCCMIAFDLVAGVIRMLSKDQKYVRFDSLIFPGFAILKDLALRGACFYWFVTRHIRELKEFSIFVNLFIGLLLLLADKNTCYYNAKFKKWMVMLDLCLIFTVLFPVLFALSSHTLTFTGHMIVVGINICAATAYSLVWEEGYEILFKANPWEPMRV
jgi:hypothetical protein